MVKNPPAIWETWIQSLGWDDPLNEGVATHSSIPAWSIPMDRGAWWATVHKESHMTGKLSTEHHLHGWDTGGWGRQYRKGKKRVGKKQPSLAPLPLKLLLSLPSFFHKQTSGIRSLPSSYPFFAIMQYWIYSKLDFSITIAPKSPRLMSSGASIKFSTKDGGQSSSFSISQNILLYWNTLFSLVSVTPPLLVSLIFSHENFLSPSPNLLYKMLKYLGFSKLSR